MINPIEISKPAGHDRLGALVPERTFQAPATATTTAIREQVDVPESATEDPVDVQNLFGRISAGKEALNRTAGEIRTLGEARNLIEKVSANLEVIVKSFPPFPPGSIEREQFLNSVAGIRAMIERLTFPPPQDKSLPEVLSGEAFVNPAASDQELSQGLHKVNEEVEQVIQAQKRLADSIPLLPETSAEEPYFTEQSRGVGKALLEGRQSIGRDPRNLLGMIG